MRETFEQLVARLNASAYIPASTGDSPMAKQYKLPKGAEFVFTKAAATSKYPWGQWFDGTLWLLEGSEKDEEGNVTTKGDFDVPVNFMTSKIKASARRQYKVAEISRRDHTGKKLANGIVIRARDMTPEERVAEDQLRAEEKEAKKAKKAEENGAATNEQE